MEDNINTQLIVALHNGSNIAECPCPACQRMRRAGELWKSAEKFGMSWKELRNGK